MKDQEYKDRRLVVLRRFLKIVQSEENSFQVSGSFQTKERSKMGRKRKNLHIGCLLRTGHAPLCFFFRLKIACCLFFMLDQWKRPIFFS